MNIAAYCRVSTEKEDQLNSLETQKNFFKEYTDRSGDRLVRLYADEGLSGTKIKNRKQFLKMMTDAESGLFDMVVVKDIEVIEQYFSNILKSKKNVTEYVVNEFQKVYRAKDENVAYEKELRTAIEKLKRNRQKYMNMYTDDLITREELNSKIGGDKQEMNRLQEELKMVEQHLTKGDRLQIILADTFKEIEDISNLRTITNAQLRRVIDRIEVDRNGNVEVFLKFFRELGLGETVRICNSRT